MARSQDVLALIRGLQTVIKAGINNEEKEIARIWSNSSVRQLLNSSKEEVDKNVKTANLSTAIKVTSDGVERVSTVFTGINQFVGYKAKETISVGTTQKQEYSKLSSEPIETTKVPNPVTTKSKPDYQIKLSEDQEKFLKELDVKFLKKSQDSVTTVKMSEIPVQKVNSNVGAIEVDSRQEKVSSNEQPKEEKKKRPTVMPNVKSMQTLSANAKARTVPSSRIGRMVSFGSLAAGLGIGTAAEFARRTIGISKNQQGESETLDSLFLNPANTERIVDTLCKVRGAALKIGQILSIQDENIVSPHVAKAFERVRRSADFMPEWQVEKVLIRELGSEWRQKLAEFDMKPFAAASIGQVHLAKTLDGRDVAMKIQYPGVAQGITSDIDNLVGVMKLWNIFPEGMFIDNVIKVAKRELAWEVDYLREAECTKKFKELLKPYPEFFVPDVIDELSTKEVFTTELIEGIPVEKCFEMSSVIRKDISEKLMRLATMELLEFQYMQTDPNWANFFYNPTTKQVLLLDFGASRGYTKEFMNIYARILRAASQNNRDEVLHFSRELGFFTGYESKVMEEAHVDAVMALGEMFQVDGEFNFADQNVTKKVAKLVPTMLAHRLCPPPEEIYSLHRKLSGVFLLSSKLQVPINCRRILYEQLDKYDFNSV